MHNFNEGISTARFPDILKGAEVKPIFKKKSTIDQENYRAVSIFSVISKIFERLIFKQLIMIFEPVFSKYQCRFQKGHSAQNWPFVVLLLPGFMERCKGLYYFLFIYKTLYGI